ncbi:polysaccharide deacetylase family protein [Bacillaceae bacterium SIJ1]|nr:polysaccharide deacetylase family protein [Litoribacterium kuwaitense]
MSWLVFTVLCVGMLAVLFSSPVDYYIQTLKNGETVLVTATDSESRLREQIEAHADKVNIPPKNAVVDRVWKAIPGLNGLEVDVDASLERMKKKQRFQENLVVFKEVPPQVTLSDLPPAPVYKGHPDKPMVAFIVNVAWGNEYIPDILQILREEGLRVSFFLEGRWTKENMELARMIAQDGHSIGNHSYSHPQMERLSLEAARQEISKTNEVIEAVLGNKPQWFGPPSGGYNDLTIQAAAEENMRTVLWSVDTIDWKNPNPDEMAARVSEQIHPGAIVLMHPTEAVTKGLRPMIKQIQAKDLRISNISDVLSEQRKSQEVVSLLLDDF